ncbi:protein serine threonine phosphatase 2c [Malassezia pachydermatis]|uniref:Protein phosphatase n=1 Tax=Malassezia pachydermatis TaxID=77020 RepID=A0A0M9VQZ6_9BASI|nr:protein serine threonine phosphatase 2c [Malassezia pachydermatis]KOS16059.1 protein serine threonine phosphatase 2c [Malassezia pachydermatis]
MIPSSRSWRSGYATAGTLKRIVVPSTAARAPKPMPRVMAPVRPLHNASAPQPTPTAAPTTAEPKPMKIVTAYAFAAKPRETVEVENKDGEEHVRRSPPPRLRGGIEPTSEIGIWRSNMLKGGDAGEDALMISKSLDNTSVMMGVADGVGGWSESGIDSSHYSNALLHYATKYAEKHATFPTPKAVLEHAFEQVAQNPDVVAGSSTACLLRLDGVHGKLTCANVGDSGFVHLRPDPTSPERRMNVVYSSAPQLYGFNCPYQLAKVPKNMLQPGSLTNQPSDAALHEMDLQRGDMVLVMTDGFLDNVHCKLPPKESLTPDAPQRPELLQLIDMLQDKHREHWASTKKPNATATEEKQDFTNVVASTLMQYARLCQMTEEKVSPFQIDAAQHGFHYPGGKVDDIALICAIVV